MKHIPDERLQRYLVGELDLPERHEIETHLTLCPGCEEELARLAAEDAILTESLALSPEEEAWIASVDLTEPVMQRLTPWSRNPVIIAAGLMLLVSGTLMLQELAWRIEEALLAETPIGLAASLFWYGVGVIRLMARYLSLGGLLSAVWPVVIIGMVIWIRRQGRREERHCA